MDYKTQYDMAMLMMDREGYPTHGTDTMELTLLGRLHAEIEGKRNAGIN